MEGKLAATVAILLTLSLAIPAATFAAKDAVTARPQVAPPTSTPSYARVGEDLPMDGITVRQPGQADDLDDYDDAPMQSIADPIEPWNRFWFGFNDFVYVKILDPAYRGWTYVVHWQIRDMFHNFFHNLCFPVRFVNNILQFKFKAAGVEAARFLANSSAGFGGLFDVTKNKRTIVPVHPEGEDFGQTLGKWGIGHGFYIVWPLLGPSSARETVGLAGDMVCRPTFWASYVIEPWYAPTAASTGFFFNDLNDSLETYISLKSAAVDPYIAMREAWVKHRAVQVAR